MVFGTKEEQDLYVSQIIKNLICDQTAFNIDKREAFHSWHEVLDTYTKKSRSYMQRLNNLKVIMKSMNL